MREDGLDRCRMFIGERVGELRVCGCAFPFDVVLGVEMGLTLQGVAHSGSMCVFLLRAVVWCHEREKEEGKQTRTHAVEEARGSKNTRKGGSRGRKHSRREEDKRTHTRVGGGRGESKNTHVKREGGGGEANTRKGRREEGSNHTRKGEEGGEANTPREEARPNLSISPFRCRLVDVVGLKRILRELHHS